MAPPKEKLDSIIKVVTPENIGFEYRIAGPFRRLPAYLIDLCIMMMIAWGVTVLSLMVLSWISSGIAGFVILVTLWGVYWSYLGIAETFLNGQTPGKWLLGLRVLNYDGQPINASQAMLRNFLRLADNFLPLVGPIVMMLNRRYQRLGDLVAGTIVVVEERHWLTGVAKLDDPRAIQLAAYLPPNFVVSKSMARALSTYVERRKFFSQPRRREVAKHLAEPLLIKFGLPADTSYDLLLCSLYYRTFIADRGDDEKNLADAQAAARAANPFYGMQPPQYPQYPYPQPYGAPPYAPAGYAPYGGYPQQAYPYGAPAYGPPGYGPPTPYPQPYGFPQQPPPGGMPLPQEQMAGTSFGTGEVR